MSLMLRLPLYFCCYVERMRARGNRVSDDIMLFILPGIMKIMSRLMWKNGMRNRILSKIDLKYQSCILKKLWYDPYRREDVITLLR